MEKAFQQILTEIYHIVSKKVIDADDKGTKVGVVVALLFFCLCFVGACLRGRVCFVLCAPLCVFVPGGRSLSQ